MGAGARLAQSLVDVWELMVLGFVPEAPAALRLQVRSHSPFARPGHTNRSGARPMLRTHLGRSQGLLDIYGNDAGDLVAAAGAPCALPERDLSSGDSEVGRVS